MNKPILPFTFLTIALVIIGVYLYYINLYAVNIPITDDYDLIRVKYTLLTNDFSWWQKIKLLLEPENDHRILIPRSIALVVYAIKGYIDYRTLIWIVNGSLLGILVFWLVSFLKKGIAVWYFIPVLLWYLTPFVFDVTLWGINGMQHTTLNLLVFATFYVLANYSGLFPTIAAFLLAFAATFTNGNGFLVFPAGLTILLLAKDWKKSVWWSIGMVVALLAYFLNYSVGQATKVTISGQFIQNLIVSFAALSGGWVAAFKGNSLGLLLWSSFAVGLITLITLVIWLTTNTIFALPRASKNKPYFWVGVFMFSVMTIGIIAVSRGGRDVYSVFTSRYSLYPLHLLTLVYAMLLMWKPIPQRWLSGLATAFGLVFAAASVYQYQIDVDIRRRSLVADHYNWRQHRKLITHFRSELADFFTQPAYDKGIYRFSNSPLAAAEPALTQPADTLSLQPLRLTLSSHSKPVDFFGHPQTVWQFTLENNDCVQPEIGRGNGVFIVLKSPQNTIYLLPTWPNQAGKKDYLLRGKIYRPGFRVTLFNENFKPNNYRLGLLYSTNEGEKIQYTTTILRVDSVHTQLLTRP
ncbi:hypothetical protein [Runella sp.]|uniref:hypothetical protein n=1 Tax=Runella sp. TaxID=1960881 RepID=UPI003D121E3A